MDLRNSNRNLFVFHSFSLIFELKNNSLSPLSSLNSIKFSQYFILSHFCSQLSLIIIFPHLINSFLNIFLSNFACQMQAEKIQILRGNPLPFPAYNLIQFFPWLWHWHRFLLNHFVLFLVGQSLLENSISIDFSLSHEFSQKYTKKEKNRCTWKISFKYFFSWCRGISQNPFRERVLIYHYFMRSLLLSDTFFCLLWGIF